MKNSGVHSKKEDNADTWETWIKKFWGYADVILEGCLIVNLWN